MRVLFEEVPLDVRRRVANFLESLRETLMEGAEAARLGNSACPIHRPDVRGVAYWEVEVVGLKATPTNTSGVGFVIASAGRHDMPIPHWSLNRPPPSRALEAAASTGKVARIMKLDALAYAAEDAAGNLVSNLGQLPVRIGGIPTDVDITKEISTFEASPMQPLNSDAELAQRKVVQSGSPPRKVELAAWRSWAEAKREYATAYKLHLDALAARASSAWKTEDEIVNYGEGIHAGTSLTVPLLKPGTVSLVGEGAKFVELTLLGQNPPAVRLTALDSTQKAAFELRINYADRTTEVLKFFAAPSETSSDTAGDGRKDGDNFNPQPDPPI